MALSAARPQTERMGEHAIPPLLECKVAASTIIYAGAMVMLDAGYAKPAATAVGKVIIGRAEATVDNSAGSAGAKSITVRRGVFKWNNSDSGDAIAQAQVGTICYAVDDQTVAKTSNSGARSPAGVVVVVEANGVFVQQGILSESEVDALAPATATAVVTLTDSTGLDGTHDDTLAATTVPAAITGGESPTEAEHNALRAVVAVMAQNASDMAQKIIELRAALAAANIVT